MKAKLLKRSRRGCKIEKRGNEYRFISPSYFANLGWTSKQYAEAWYRSYILQKAREIYKPAKETIIKY